MAPAPVQRGVAGLLWPLAIGGAVLCCACCRRRRRHGHPAMAPRPKRRWAGSHVAHRREAIAKEEDGGMPSNILSALRARQAATRGGYAAGHVPLKYLTQPVPAFRPGGSAPSLAPGREPTRLSRLEVTPPPPLGVLGGARHASVPTILSACRDGAHAVKLGAPPRVPRVPRVPHMPAVHNAPGALSRRFPHSEVPEAVTDSEGGTPPLTPSMDLDALAACFSVASHDARLPPRSAARQPRSRQKQPHEGGKAVPPPARRPPSHAKSSPDQWRREREHPFPDGGPSRRMRRSAAAATPTVLSEAPGAEEQRRRRERPRRERDSLRGRDVRGEAAVRGVSGGSRW